MLISALLLIAQIVSLKIFDYFEREPRAKALAQEIVTIVNFDYLKLETKTGNCYNC